MGNNNNNNNQLNKPHPYLDEAKNVPSPLFVFLQFFCGFWIHNKLLGALVVILVAINGGLRFDTSWDVIPLDVTFDTGAILLLPILEWFCLLVPLRPAAPRPARLVFAVYVTSRL